MLRSRTSLGIPLPAAAFEHTVHRLLANALPLVQQDRRCTVPDPQGHTGYGEVPQGEHLLSCSHARDRDTRRGHNSFPE